MGTYEKITVSFLLSTVLVIHSRCKLPLPPLLFSPLSAILQAQRRKNWRNAGRMFFSQALLWRKGPVANIWTAAYYFKKLKRDQIAQTDIASSVGLFSFFPLD